METRTRDRVCEFCGASYTLSKWPSLDRPGVYCSDKYRQNSSRGPDRKVNPDGYVMLRTPDHPRPLAGDFVYEHILVMESFLGRYLVYPEVVHHRDHDRGNNAISNLHLCVNQAEHVRIHALERISEAGGNPETDAICFRCRKVDQLHNFVSQPTKFKPSTCKACAAEIQGERRRLGLNKKYLRGKRKSA